MNKNGWFGGCSLTLFVIVVGSFFYGFFSQYWLPVTVVLIAIVASIACYGYHRNKKIRDWATRKSQDLSKIKKK